MKRTDKLLCTSILILLMPLISTFTCYAAEIPDFGQNELYDAVSDEGKSILEIFGIEGFSHDETGSVDTDKAIRGITEAIKKEISKPKKCTGVILGFVILSALCESFIPDKNGNYITPVLSAVCVVTVYSDIRAAVTAAGTAMAATVKFINALVPVLTLITAFSGKSISAAGFAGISFFGVQIISFIAGNILPYFTDVMLAFVLAGSITNDFDTGKLISFIRKAVMIILSFCAVIFSGLCAVTGAGGVIKDGLGMRSLRFILGSAVPVIGGNLSETLASVISYAVTIRNSAGIIGIIAVICINAGVLIRLAVWKITLELCGCAAQFVKRNALQSSIEGICEIIGINISLLLFVVYLSFSSVGLLLIIVK